VNRAAFIAGAAALAAARPSPAGAATLYGKIARAAQSLPGEIGVYARTLAPGGPLVTYQAREVFPTASIIKVLIMATAFAAQERHSGALNETIVFHRGADLIGGSDFMSEQEDGARFTVRQLIVPMIQVSDNTAANLLIEHFGIRAINAMGKRAGMTRTHLGRTFLDTSAIVHHHDNVSTPADMGHLLYAIERGAHEAIPTIVSAEHCRTMVEIMLGQTDREKIPQGLPPGTKVANKTGEITGTRNDVAIIGPFGDQPVILTIMTKNLTDYWAADTAIHAIARAVYASA
jgi:beta-lactamase class A